MVTLKLMTLMDTQLLFITNLDTLKQVQQELFLVISHRLTDLT